MSGPGLAELQRWSEEVARDAGSPSFLPLAEAYRRLGKTQAALRVCLRGLERSPGHVDAHLLLARLYLELGDRERAADEWAVAARLDPDNFDAHRGLGFFHLERGELPSAGRHLERAVLARPADPAVQEALTVLRRRQVRGIVPRKARGAAAADNGAPAAPAATPAGSEGPRDVAQDTGTAPASDTPAGEAASPDGDERESHPPRGAAERDPTRVFEPLGVEAPYLGGLLLDAHGLVLAGSFRTDGVERGDALGAVIGAAAEEAARTAQLLSIGAWRGILIETDRALLHVAPVDRDLLVLTAAERGTPMGWALRTAQRAVALARRFLEAET